MKIRYRRISLFFALMFLHYGTGGKIYSSDNSELFSEQIFATATHDEREIKRRGLLNQIMNAIEGVASITEDVLLGVLSPIRQLIKLDQDAIVNNPHRKDDAEVRLGVPVCDEELEFREKRFAVVKKAQEKLTGMRLEDDDVLEITFSYSGGGMRAKTYALGSCFGADKIGLLDCVMCASGLSGGTWFLAPWITSETPIAQYRTRGIEDTCDAIDIQSVEDLGPMLDALWVKFAYGQTINSIDLYGGWLGNNFLRGYGKEQHMVYLSDQVDSIADGSFPFPVYTAILANRDMPNHWFEFTPFEVGSRWLGAYTPTWAFGRKFKRGDSKSSAPEQSLGFMMGIYGSAYAANFEEAYDCVIKNMKPPKFLRDLPACDEIFSALKKLIGKLMRETDLGEVRLAWAQVFNYVYKLRSCNFNGKKDLKLADAGVDLNNPVFATYRNGSHGEAPDIVFVFDSSAGVGIKNVEVLAAYAERNNMKFPKVYDVDFIDSAYTVFGDIEDVDTPLVVYMPRVVDQDLLFAYEDDNELGGLVELLIDFDIDDAIHNGFAKTFNFEYTQHQAELVAGLAEFNIRVVKKEIQSIIKKRIAAKRKARQL